MGGGGVALSKYNIRHRLQLRLTLGLHKVSLSMSLFGLIR
jgi:hypothetical protein